MGVPNERVLPKSVGAFTVAECGADPSWFYRGPPLLSTMYREAGACRLCLPATVFDNSSRYSNTRTHPPCFWRSVDRVSAAALP